MDVFILVTIVLFFGGLFVGSFLNVVIARLGTESFVGGRSRCPQCLKTLRWWELVPVLSFVFLRARCSGCRRKISWQYPLVELATGLLFVLAFLHLVSTAGISTIVDVLNVRFLVELLLILATLSTLVVIFVYDLYHKIIPDPAVFLFIALSIILLVLSHIPDFSWSIGVVLDILAGPILALPFYLAWRLSHGTWMGLGDAKLALGIGFFLGFILGISAVVLSFWIGAAVALSLLATQRLAERWGKTRLPRWLKSLTMRSEVPFGPFLILGVVIVYFTGLDVLGLSLLIQIL